MVNSIMGNGSLKSVDCGVMMACVALTNSKCLVMLHNTWRPTPSAVAKGAIAFMGNRIDQ